MGRDIEDLIEGRESMQAWSSECMCVYSIYFIGRWGGMWNLESVQRENTALRMGLWWVSEEEGGRCSGGRRS